MIKCQITGGTLFAFASSWRHWKSQRQLWERYSATQPFLTSSRNALMRGSVAWRHKGRLCSRLWEKCLGQKGIFINGQWVKNKVNWGHENLSKRNENLAHSLRGRRKQFGRARERATRARSTRTRNPPSLLPSHFKAYHAGDRPQSTEISVFIDNQYKFLLTSFSMRFLVFLVA